MELNSALEKMQNVQSFPNLRPYPTILQNASISFVAVSDAFLGKAIPEPHRNYFLN